jgi:lysozyme
METGIDVSSWQDPNKLNLPEIAKTHSFLIARATYGVASDPTFRAHIRNARAAGMTVGAYHFFRQTQGWGEQLASYQGELDAVGLTSGDLVPVVDLEWNERYDGKVRADVFNSQGRALVEELRNRYGDCYVYLSPGFFQTLGKPEWLLKAPWWIAHYTNETAPWCPFKEWDIWQYTSKGRVVGYPNDIDINLAKRLVRITGAPDTGKDDAPPGDERHSSSVSSADLQHIAGLAESAQRLADSLRELHASLQSGG